MDAYTFNQHRHNYATWTAARAVQRNFTTTGKIKYAIERSGLRDFSESDQNITKGEFDQLHQIWAEQLTHAFSSKGVPNCSYGRAAKIISIYLKTSIILCNKANCNRSPLIHPPIDGILLRNVSQCEGLSDLKSIKWTILSKDEYWHLTKRLTDHFKFFDWRLEHFWSPELD